MAGTASEGDRPALGVLGGSLALAQAFALCASLVAPQPQKGSVSSFPVRALPVRAQAIVPVDSVRPADPSTYDPDPDSDSSMLASLARHAGLPGSGLAGLGEPVSTSRPASLGLFSIAPKQGPPA